MGKHEAKEILHKPGHIFSSDREFDEILKQEESLCNNTTIKRWKDATVEESYDPLEGDHIGINSEFFE